MDSHSNSKIYEKNYSGDKLIDELIAAGADVNAPAPNKATPLMLAARNGHIDVVRRLLALPQTDLNALNDAGFSADAWALQNNNTDIAELIEAERKRAASVRRR